MIYLLGLLLLVALISWKYHNVMTQKRENYFQQIDAYEHKRKEEILRRAKKQVAEHSVKEQHVDDEYVYSSFKKTA
ncbi:hypothetical protein [Enterococcus sp. AZ109]|uniref:hypothetical protein n=1 Tax=Enterococcus sp. AZ109 TaxID=2774634 RepID=UPI003F1E8870